MSKRLLVTFLAALSATVPLVHATGEVHLVMISVDGLMPSAYVQSGPARIPVIRRLAVQGAFAEGVIGVLPSVTYPSHTTLITGVTPAVHGILDNRMFDPEGKSGGANFWYARDIRVPTLLGAVRGRGWRTAAVAWPVTVGMDVDFHVPEFWRVNYGSDYPESASLLRAVSTPHLIDAVEIARGKPFPWRQSDADRLEIASFILRTYQPHLLLVHLTDLDGAQHTFGPGSPEAVETLERLDQYVGALVQIVQASSVADRTYVAVVSDHGFLPIEQQLQPNALFKQEGLLTVNPAGQITAWQAVFHASGGSGFVYLHDPADRGVRTRVAALLNGLRDNPGYGIETIWTGEDLARLGGPPDAAFGIDMRSGFYTGSGHSALLGPTRMDDGRGMRGGHGHGPMRKELYSSLVVSGPSLRGRGSLGIVRMTQIAPTFARWLGVGLSPASDVPIEALISSPGATR